MNAKSLRVLEYAKIKQMLVTLCVSQEAKHHAETLMPSIDIAEIISLQQETTEAQGALLKRDFHMSRILDITDSIKLARIGSMLKNQQFLDLTDTMRTARSIKRYLSSVKDEQSKFMLLEGHAEKITYLKVLEEEIERIILNEDQIADDASRTLFNIRRTIESKHRQIRDKLESMLQNQSTQKYLQDSLITIRDNRFVIPVKSEHKSRVKGIVHDQSASGSTFYIEPMAVVNLNNDLRTLYLDEQAEIERILTELTARVAEHADEIITNYHVLTTLDFIFAKGKLSINQKGMMPEISPHRYMCIKNGKHPLLDVNTVVPTNFYIGDKFDSLLITGPNTGGKTVTLKTVGLLALMAQSGLHLPCDHGTIMPVFKKIYADIGDEQSIEQSLSTFSSHMTNIVDIIEHVDKDALVLFDELGAGTDPTEGAALAMAILNHVYLNGAITVATTHYSELKHFALSTEGFENASVEFDITTLSPTYKLLIGVPGKSNAFEISRKLGLSNTIIKVANQFLDSDDIAFEDVMQAIETHKKAADKDRDEAQRLKLDAERLFERAKTADDKIKAQKERVIDDAKREAKKIVKEAKQDIDALMKDLRKLKQQTNVDTKAFEQLRQQINEKNKALTTKVDFGTSEDGDIPKKLKIGQQVMISTLGQKGSVLTLPNDKGDLQLQVGIMKMNANIKNLRVTGQSQKQKKKYSYERSREVSAVTVRSEIDLRGQNLDEARMNLDKYLDDASISGHQQVTIIHGVGTGVLKKGLTDFMKRHTHVKTLRAGAYGEGGAGVTVVMLK